MDYTDIETARTANGLRITLTAGLPAPWSEALKAMLKFKHIPYMPVAQIAGEANEDLVAWTGYRNAPTAMLDDEPAKVTWLDMLNLVERLAPEPSLVPQNMDDRILMNGLMNEIGGENGYLWLSRLMMFHSLVTRFGEEALAGNPMVADYRYNAADAEAALPRVIQILDRLAQQVDSQAERGSRFLIGEQVSALDLYWASFSQTLQPLPQEVNPMPDSLRKAWGGINIMLNEVDYTPDPCLFEQRDFIFEHVIGLPLDF